MEEKKVEEVARGERENLYKETEGKRARVEGTRVSESSKRIRLGENRFGCGKSNIASELLEYWDILLEESSRVFGEDGGSEEEVWGEGREGFEESKIGVSVWSVNEKSRFFRGLRKFGRHEIEKICDLVNGRKGRLEYENQNITRGSRRQKVDGDEVVYKSIFECRLYEMRLRASLERAMEEIEVKRLVFRANGACEFAMEVGNFQVESENASSDARGICADEVIGRGENYPNEEEVGVGSSREELLSYREIPAAFEVQENGRLYNFLESAAAYWTKVTWEMDVKREIEEFGEFALLNQNIADSLGTVKQARENDLLDHVKSANLLNLANFLVLSRNIFMSPFAPCPSPSIFHSAFDAFHKIVVDLVRKIVQTTVKLAEQRVNPCSGNFSELEASSPSVSGPHFRKRLFQRFVNKSDVKLALSILNLETTAFNYWIDVVKRYKLSIYTRPVHSNSSRYPIFLTADQARIALQYQSSKSMYAYIESLVSHDENNSPSTVDSSGVSSSLTDTEDEEMLEGVEDDDIDALDIAESRCEEQRLCQLFNLDNSIIHHETTKFRQVKSFEDLRDFHRASWSDAHINQYPHLQS